MSPVVLCRNGHLKHGKRGGVTQLWPLQLNEGGLSMYLSQDVLGSERPCTDGEPPRF